MNRRVLATGLLAVVPLLLLLFINLGRDPHTVDSPLIGKPAPPFTLVPVGGGAAISLAGLRGRPVVVNFWATWCVPCFQEHGVLVQAARALGSEAQFLGVVYDDEEPRVKSFLSERGSSYPSLLDPDGKTAIAYGIFGVPETYFIDPAGTIVSKYVGPLTAELLGEHLRQARVASR